jgi:glycosyltransferase involved in cell wall biosynthesis
MTRTDERISIIVPVFNEAATVTLAIERLMAVRFPVPREVVVVNDGSTDGTRRALDGMAAGDSLRVFHAAKNGGKGSAIRQGLEHVRGTIVAIQDADLELDPAQLALLVEPILRGESAVVYGSRFLAGRPKAPFATIVGNRVLTAATNILYGGRLTDIETCYKVMRTDVARSLGLQSDRFDIEPEITAKLLRRKISILERPIAFEPRKRDAGKKIRWRDGVFALRALLKYRF